MPLFPATQLDRIQLSADDATLHFYLDRTAFALKFVEIEELSDHGYTILVAPLVERHRTHDDRVPLGYI
ncbi:hypothetical protein A8E63_29375 [Burkholderia cenocepacia]|nr:hypothetical protein [Burkholderia contaminans]MBA9910110.1 hypothetical protein [Burkholderia contaminans]ONU79886.1 hypothetical protein A8E63_29375 [Burkholderia cenocepacia]